jgi:hypothetical protein
MGFLDNVSLVNQIKVFTALNTTQRQDEKQVNNSSNLNKEDTLLFLLDIISLILGSTYLRIILSAFLNDLLGSLDDEIKKFLKTTNNTQLSNTPATAYNLTLPMSLLDYNDQFKIDPKSIEGSQIYTNGSFNTLFYNNVLNGNNSSSFFGGLVSASYSQNTNLVGLGANNIQGDKESHLNALLDSITLIDTQYVINATLDALFNTVSKKKSITGIKNELLVDNALGSMLKDQDENEAFSLEIENVSQYEVEAKIIKSGTMALDFGCDIQDMSLDRDFLNQTFSNPILRFESALNTVLQDNGTQNNQAIGDNFYKTSSSKLLLNLIKAILLSPQMIMYLLIRTLLLNGVTTIPLNAIDLLKQQFGLTKLIACHVKNKFVDFAFNLFRRELLRIILPVLKRIVKEKILSYKNILISLVKK